MNTYVTIDSEKYRLSFTVAAAKEVSLRYGGFEQMSKAISNGDTADRLSEVAWLVTLLANQAIKQDNLHNHENKPLLNVEDVELLTEIPQISEYVHAVFSCFRGDTERHVTGGSGADEKAENGADEKNA